MPQVVISGGQAAVPTVPGWGFEPDKEFLVKAKYKISG